MKRDTLSIITAFFCTVTSVAPGHAESNATILLNYPDAVLTLDDRGFSYLGVDSISTEPGIHYLSLYFPPRDNQWLPPIVSRPYRLEENDTMIVNRQSVRYLHVSTNPEDATVFLGDHPVGKTPLALSILEHLDTTMGLEKEGYQTLEIDLKEITGRSIQMILSLEASQTRGKYPPSPATIEESDGGVPGWIPFATLSYFITSTALGFYNKARADDVYEDYLRTSSVERMNHEFDRVKVLDNRARVFWVTGQVALGATIYLFVKNFRSHSTERPLPALSLGLSPQNGGRVYVALTLNDVEW